MQVVYIYIYISNTHTHIYVYIYICMRVYTHCYSVLSIYGMLMGARN